VGSEARAAESGSVGVGSAAVAEQGWIVMQPRIRDHTLSHDRIATLLISGFDPVRELDGVAGSP
jgi:hypothetical protein